MRIGAEEARALAWYESGDGIGVLGPRGWRCDAASGSGGAALYLSPREEDLRLRTDKGFTGPAIELDHTTNENSGRHQIAEMMLRIFPFYREFATRVMEDMDFKPPSPWPKDTLTYRRFTMVEYSTPAGAEGLGTADTWLKKNDRPVRGAAILTGDPKDPDLLLLAIRLPADLERLAPAIIRQLEEGL